MDISKTQIALLRWLVGGKVGPIPPRCGVATFAALGDRNMATRAKGGWVASPMGHDALAALDAPGEDHDPTPGDEYLET